MRTLLEAMRVIVAGVVLLVLCAICLTAPERRRFVEGIED